MAVFDNRDICTIKDIIFKMKKLNFPQKLDLFYKVHKIGFWILLIILYLISYSQTVQISGQIDESLTLLNIVRYALIFIIYIFYLHLFCEVYFMFQKSKNRKIDILKFAGYTK